MGRSISLTRTRKVDERLEFSKREDFDNRGTEVKEALVFLAKRFRILLRLYDKKKEQENKKSLFEDLIVNNVVNGT